MQLTEDVKEECADYGTVEGLIIPQPPRTLPPTEPGRAYIKFASHEEASKAKPVFDGRLFDSIKITAKLVPDDDYQRSSDGEWVHIPMPGGLPAHPGQALLFPIAIVLYCKHNEDSVVICCMLSLGLIAHSGCECIHQTVLAHIASSGSHAVFPTYKLFQHIQAA